MLITVDCAITATAEVAHARGLGMDVIVTDHHRPAGQLPDCPVVHPGLGKPPSGSYAPPGCLSSPQPSPEASRTSIWPAWRPLRHGPLHGENRESPAGAAGAVTHHQAGPARADAGRGAGAGRRRHPGRGLSPRAQDQRGRAPPAGGRRAGTAAHGRQGAATEVAQELDGLNHDRRATEQRILHAAEAACAGQMSAAAIVVAGEGWHPGVVGIVASRLVERHRRPCVVIGLDGGSGAARDAASLRTTCTPASRPRAPPDPLRRPPHGGRPGDRRRGDRARAASRPMRERACRRMTSSACNRWTPWIPAEP